MFELTRQEKVLIAGFILIFLLGFGVKQWRDSAAFDSQSAQVP
jgi:predicted negative regulator of RcsB-dependent stress response